jgi:hypothetical protein
MMSTASVPRRNIDPDGSRRGCGTEALAGISQRADDGRSRPADYVVSTWYGIWGVKGTEGHPRSHACRGGRLQSPELREIWASNGSEVSTMSQQEFAKFLAARSSAGPR